MLGLQQWFMENGAERIEHPLEIVENRERRSRENRAPIRDRGE
jgi:hypothetical protein